MMFYLNHSIENYRRNGYVCKHL